MRLRRTSPTTLKGAAIALWVLNVVDAFLTRAILAGGGREVNPLLGGWINTWWGSGIKIVAVTAILVFIVRCASDKRLAQEGVPVIALFYLLVVLWNLSVLLSQLTVKGLS